MSAEEQIAPDEARITQAIIQDAIRVVEQHRDNTRVLRDAHAKAHGCVKAEFKVRADLDPTLRRGVFAEPGKSWNAWAASCFPAKPTIFCSEAPTRSWAGA